MSEEITAEWCAKTFESVKNWGRWGADDQMGALHYITPARRARAARTVRDGVTVSCSLDFPVVPSIENPTPALHHMIVAGDACTTLGGGLETALDFIGVAFHGMATSHIDALCHVFVNETMYNGFPASDVKSIGALENDIMVARDGITGRGVLLDVPRLHGKPWLEVADRIRPADLEAAERAQRVRVEEGDILLVSTGRTTFCRDSPCRNGRFPCTSAAWSRWASTCSTTSTSRGSPPRAPSGSAGSSCLRWRRCACAAEPVRR